MSLVSDNKFDDIYNYVVWNSTEQRYREWAESQSTVSVTEKPSQVLLSAVLKSKMENSLLGSFMYHLNSSQTQSINIIKDKLNIAEFDSKFCSEQRNVQYDICSDIFDLIKRASEVGHDRIEMTDFLMCMNEVRLIASQITLVDNGLLKLFNLRLLSLALNRITELPGYYLPRSLIFLELYGNVITNIEPLTQEFPKQLLHLGLGRNSLTNDSNLKLLGNLKDTKLMSLDLKENDIYNLKECLDSLSDLHNLVALNLKGNPCAICHSYSTMALRSLPQLRFLDNAEVCPSDREHSKNIKLESHTETSGTLLFYCYRLMGVEQPSEERMNSYHIEVELPLLDPKLRVFLSKKFIHEDDTEKEVIKATENTLSTKPVKSGRKLKKKHKTPTKNVSEKNITEDDTVLSKDNENDEKLKEKENHPEELHVNEGHETCFFETEKLPWSKVIEFSTPTLRVAPPDNDLKLLRDTFWTKARVRIIHTKAAPSKGKKEKKKATREKKASSKKNVHKKDVTVKDQPEIKELAAFDVSLEQIDWFENSLDYVWSKDNGNVPLEATKTQEKLKDLVYDVGKKVGNVTSSRRVKTATEDEGSGQQSTTNTLVNKISKLDVPVELTCHLGFGLKRLNLKNWET